MENEHKGGCLVSLGQAFAWLVTSLLAVADMLYVREAVLAILSALQSAKDVAYHAAGGVGLDFSTGFAVSLADDVMILIMGIATIGAVVTIEYYFRKGQCEGCPFRAQCTECKQGRTVFISKYRELLLAARAAKDWTRSDELRQALGVLGVDVKDGPTGSTWRPRLAPAG